MLEPACSTHQWVLYFELSELLDLMQEVLPHPHLQSLFQSISNTMLYAMYTLSMQAAAKIMP